MPALLFVDDDFVDHDPGEFDDDVDRFPDDGGHVEDATAAPAGLMGYFLRPLQKLFDVTAVTGPDEALKVINSTSFDVIILDVMIPPSADGIFNVDTTVGGLRTGFVLAEEIRVRSSAIPIVILSQVVPGQDSGLNKSTVDDLISRRVIQGVFSKLDEAGDPDAFASKILDLVQSGDV